MIREYLHNTQLVCTTAAILGCAGYAGQETLDRRARAPGARARRARLRLARGRAGAPRSTRASNGCAARLRHERGGARGRRRRRLPLPRPRARRPRSSRPPTRSSSTSRARTGCATPRSTPSGTASSTRGPTARRLELRAPGALPADGPADREPRLLRDRGAARARPARRRDRPGDASSSTRSPASRAPGRALKPSSHAGFVLENVSPYRVGAHQHAPEIEQALGFPVCFVPHLLPVRRGLLATCYVAGDADDLRERLEEAYAAAPRGPRPARGRRAGARARAGHRRRRGRASSRTARPAATIVVCALDNLGKGAAGQAVQNANLALGLDRDARACASPESSYERHRAPRASSPAASTAGIRSEQARPRARPLARARDRRGDVHREPRAGGARARLAGAPRAGRAAGGRRQLGRRERRDRASAASSTRSRPPPRRRGCSACTPSRCSSSRPA